MLAAWKGHLPVARLLMEQCDMSDEVRAGVDIYDMLWYIVDDECMCCIKGGNAPLIMAACNGHFPIVQLLVEQGASIDLVNKVRAGEAIYAILCYIGGNMLI